jgi:hypothetical protein
MPRLVQVNTMQLMILFFNASMPLANKRGMHL